MTPDQIRNGKIDHLNHSSIQPWSAGAHFPGVIVRVERYETHEDYIERLLLRTPPAKCPRFPLSSEAFYALPVETRRVRTGHRAIYKGEERMFWSTDELDTYEAAAHWIACMKELDEEAAGIYEGELQRMPS